MEELKDNNLGRALEVIVNKENKDEIDNMLREIITKLNTDEKLLCISAPQLDRNYRVIGIKFSDGVQLFINPLYVTRDKLEPTIETWEDKKYLILRFDKIEIIYTQGNGTPRQVELSGDVAKMFQQMYDTLEGLCPSDYGLEVDDDFINASKEEQGEVVEAYIQSLRDIHSSLKEEINENDELRELQHTVDFMTSVAKGETTIAKKETKPNRATRRYQAKMNKQLKKVIMQDIKDREKELKNDRENNDKGLLQ